MLRLIGKNAFANGVAKNFLRINTEAKVIVQFVAAIWHNGTDTGKIKNKFGCVNVLTASEDD